MPTVLDIAKLAAHFQGTHPLPSKTDMNQDGVLNESDQEELGMEILGNRTPPDLPLATIRESSPANGEGNVALTRESILHFSLPLALNTSLDNITPIAGRADTLAVEGGTIFLPCLCAGTLQPVSPTQPTVVTFPSEILGQHPELAGVEVTIPPNSLFADDDGIRGGLVGLALIASDRIPSPPPRRPQFPLRACQTTKTA